MKREVAGREVFRANLERIMSEKRISGSELGRRVDTSRMAVSKWLAGHTEPNLNKICSIASVLGVSVGALFGEKQTNKSDVELSTEDAQKLVVIASSLMQLALEMQRRYTPSNLAQRGS